MSTPLLPPLELPPLVVVPAWVAELSAGVVVRCVVDGATAPCCEEATAGADCVTDTDADPSGEAEVAGLEAAGEGEGDGEACVGVGDGE